MKFVPTPFIPPSTNDLNNLVKCKGCGYHRKPTAEDDEMTIAYWYEHPIPHRCHNQKAGLVCKGAMESFERLGLPIDHSKLSSKVVETFMTPPAIVGKVINKETLNWHAWTYGARRGVSICNQKLTRYSRGKYEHISM